MIKLQLHHDMYNMPTPTLSKLNTNLETADNNGDEFHHLRGVANFKKFEFQAANKDFDLAIEMTPDFIDAIFHRGIVRVVRGRYNDATEDFNRVLALNPDHASALYNRGRLRYWKGLYDEAIKDFQLVRKIDPMLGRELKLRYVIGKIERRTEDDSVMAQVQSIVDRLIDF